MQRVKIQSLVYKNRKPGFLTPSFPLHSTPVQVGDLAGTITFLIRKLARAREERERERKERLCPGIYASLINSIRHGLFGTASLVLCYAFLPFFSSSRMGAHPLRGRVRQQAFSSSSRGRDDVYVWKDSLRRGRKDLSGEDNSRISRTFVSAPRSSTLLFFSFENSAEGRMGSACNYYSRRSI